MSAKNHARFALANILFAPILAVEDGLRAVGVDVPEKGLARNHDGESIMDVWNEAGLVVKGKRNLSALEKHFNSVARSEKPNSMSEREFFRDFEDYE